MLSVYSFHYFYLIHPYYLNKSCLILVNVKNLKAVGNEFLFFFEKFFKKLIASEALSLSSNESILATEEKVLVHFKIDLSYYCQNLPLLFYFSEKEIYSFRLFAIYSSSSHLHQFSVNEKSSSILLIRVRILAAFIKILGRNWTSV